MGAATALYSATCFAQGKYGNGNTYPVNLRAIIGLSGWLPGSRFDCIAYLKLVSVAEE
uniref:Acyl-protein thioesterase n=1 Tax=Solanum tuberosum TaxID=4113 RepID=M1CS38_SOLTU